MVHRDQSEQGAGQPWCHRGHREGPLLYAPSEGQPGQSHRAPLTRRTTQSPPFTDKETEAQKGELPATALATEWEQPGHRANLGSFQALGVSQAMWLLRGSTSPPSPPKPTAAPRPGTLPLTCHPTSPVSGSPPPPALSSCWSLLQWPELFPACLALSSTLWPAQAPCSPPSFPREAIPASGVL